jgi:hypothetical protein
MPLSPGRDIEGGEGMAFRELQAMQVAYELLSPLDPGAQQRAMAWLSAALADKDGAPTAVDEPATPGSPDVEVPSEVEPAASVTQATAEHAAPAAPVAEAEPEATIEPEPEATVEP